MDRDTPEVPEFASWDSYTKFAQRVRHERRYVFSTEVKAFLDTVLATIRERDVRIPQGAILYRAQRGILWQSETDEDGVETGERPVGYGRARMKPRPTRSTEGRANAAGISVLYLGTTEQTAISETRPWVGADVSVAQFKMRRELKAIDLSKGHGKISLSELTWAQLLGDEEADATTKEKAVWIEIDNAFSRPVTLSDDAGDYVPTQILAELFRDAGYDAVIYKSQFGENGYNVALFDLDDADPINCAPYEVTKIEVSFREHEGNRWYARQPDTATEEPAGKE